MCHFSDSILSIRLQNIFEKTDLIFIIKFDILILSILALVLSRKQISNFKISTINYVDTTQPLDNNGFTSEFHQYTLEKNSVREFIQN